MTEYERAVIFRLGRLKNKAEGAVGPGLFCILPCTDSYIKVDMRTVSFDIPPQEILTKGRFLSSEKSILVIKSHASRIVRSELTLG